MDIRSAENLDLKEALEAHVSEEDLLATGIKENHQRQYNRLLREGRLMVHNTVIIWSSGQIYCVPLSTNTLGERITHPTSPAPISLTAHILAGARTDDSSADMFEMETGETLNGGCDVTFNGDGKKVSWFLGE
ncbi:hypothetical protein H0H92_003417 [Tricholoma furcatifolium]|nr:hypothetical protein H0H92_003417 [Tricholoma furcatifolium]